jgi:hypothetical protein
MGHFEQGKYIEATPRMGSNILDYKIHVDTSELKRLEDELAKIKDLYTVAESMTTIWQRLRWLITGKVR